MTTEAEMDEQTKPMTLQQRRYEWASYLCDAEAYIIKAREAIKRRDFKESREHALTACWWLDNAMQFDTETPE